MTGLLARARFVLAAVAVAGLIAFAAAVLAFACWRIRRLEISYSTD